MPGSKHQDDLKVNIVVMEADKRRVYHLRMNELSPFQRRFEEAMAYAGAAGNRTAFGLKLGVAENQKQKLYNWFKRDQRIPDDQRKPLASLGISIDWLNDGEGSMLLGGPVSVVSISATVSGYVRVEQAGEADMGDGRENEDFPDVIRTVEYSEAFIRSLIGFLPPPGRMKLVTGSGDSMVPTIQPGEVVLVDTGCSSFDADGLYLINSGKGQQIKRLQDRGGEVFVVSDNPFYPPFPFPQGGIIGGKVYLKNKLERFN